MQPSLVPSRRLSGKAIAKEELEELFRRCTKFAGRIAAREIYAVQGGQKHSHEEIARRAYQIFLDRGSLPGRDLDDWLEAERQL